MTSKEDKIFISVVMIAHRNLALLQRAITSLGQFSNTKNWELILLVNGTDRAIVEYTSGLASHIRFPLKRLMIPEQKPGAARNHAIAHAVGEILFFLDDDIELFQNIFSATEELFQDPQLMAAGGANLTPPNSGLLEIATGQAMASYWGTASMSARYKQSTHTHVATEHDLILCNLAVRKRVIDTRHKIFPMHFVSNEENIFLQKLELAGLAMLASPKLAVFHHRRNTWYGLMEQCFKYGKGRAQNSLYLPESFRILYVLPSLFVLYQIILLCLLVNFIPLSVELAVVPLIFYSMGSVFFSCKDFSQQKNFRILLIQIFSYFCIHFSYGCGFWNGLMTWSWRRKKLRELSFERS